MRQIPFWWCCWQRRLDRGWKAEHDNQILPSAYPDASGDTDRGRNDRPAVRTSSRACGVGGLGRGKERPSLRPVFSSQHHDVCEIRGVGSRWSGDEIRSRSQKRKRTGRRRGSKEFIHQQTAISVTLGFFILALLSKPMAVTLPLVLLILDWYPVKRIQSVKSFRPAFVEKIPFIALSLVPRY